MEFGIWNINILNRLARGVRPDHLLHTAFRNSAGKGWTGFYILVIFLLLPWLFGCQSNEKSARVVRIGLVHGKSHSFTQAFERFAGQVEAGSGGRYQVKIYHSGQLGGENVMQEMLLLGSLDMTVTGLLNTYEPLFSLFEMPYLYRDRDHAFEVHSGAVVAEVGSSLDEIGLHLLGFYENGWRDMTNSKRPIEQPEDVEGLLIRTPENPAQIETIRALGGIPTPMSFSELYTALLQGVVDGQENPLQNIWYGRLYEAQKYLSSTHHIYNAAYVLISQRLWQDLPENDRKLFRDALRTSTRWQLDYMRQLDEELSAKMKAEGMIFTYPDRAAFERACQPAYEVLYDRLGPRAREIVARIKNTR